MAKIAIVRSRDVRNVCGSSLEAIPTEVGKRPVVKYVKTTELFKHYVPYEFNRGEGEEGMDFSRVKKIAKSIIGSTDIPPVYNGTYWLVSPIIVNSRTNKIVDGHYTATALTKVHEMTGWDLEAIVIEKEFPKHLSDREIVSMYNTMQKSWQAQNFIECYVMEGVPDYVKLKDAAIKLGYPFTNKSGKPNFRYTAALVGSVQSANLRKGTFKYDDAIRRRGEKVKELFNAMKVNRTNSWVEPFAVAYCELESFLKDRTFTVLKSNIGKIDWSGDIDHAEYWKEQFGKLI